MIHPDDQALCLDRWQHSVRTGEVFEMKYEWARCRSELTEMMEREIRRAVRAEQPLGVLMLDLDHFKKFNDTQGHDAGSTGLRDAACFLTRSVRSEDIVCRFGGEEFVISSPWPTGTCR